MKKIGIVTLHGYFNYGNKFQNYATQEVLKSLGCEPITIANDKSINRNVKAIIFNKLRRTNFKETLRFIYRQVKKLRQRIFPTRKEKKERLLNNKRAANFKNFSRNNINETNYIINEINISENFHGKFDYFIVGSDQVWNPYLIHNSSIFFLTFAPRRKRIAYSASFGISVLPDGDIKRYKDGLSQFEHISVREEMGANIVNDLTGRKVEVLIDPTLMLDKKDWLRISRKAKNKPRKPYLLIYFLGQMSNEILESINTLSKEHDIEIVTLEDKTEDIKDELRYTTSPSEFIDYLNSAELILTDSFHGTVFSILFEKAFITFDRKGERASMNSRIDTLLSKFNLKERRYETVKRMKSEFDICFSHVPSILEYERNKAIDYLKNALEIEQL